MIYLDNGATSLNKPVGVSDAVRRAMFTCANPGRGGHTAAMAAARTVLRCRERAAQMFDCQPEQVVFTSNCTHGLNIAINTLVKPGDPVVITGFEHNAVTRPLHALGARIVVAGQKLFDWDDTLEEFEKALKQGVKVAVFTHCSNVFGYIMPVEAMAQMCKNSGVPFIIDAAQSAGMLPIHLRSLGAAFIAMPGHKGLLGPQGTGVLLCGTDPKPFIYGGTGSNSLKQTMPDFLPDMLEAGTLNVPGIAGLEAGLGYLEQQGIDNLLQKEQRQASQLVRGLDQLGIKAYSGEHQTGTVSFVPPGDCEQCAEFLNQKGIAVRAGLHCAPLAHESAGTQKTGTVRVSYGHDAAFWQTERLIRTLSAFCLQKNYE